MRQIKFRAWDKKLNKWANVWDVVSFNGRTMRWDAERFDVSQFTGLLDKNGKEIYEGDIFACLYAFDGCNEHIMVVEYNEPRAGFFPRWDYAKCQQKGVEKTMHDLTRLEIIGNIYENPELLTKE